MSRSGYSEEWDGHNTPLEFYRQAVHQAIRGRRGQMFLVDLAAALDAMPEKRLVADDLQTETGAVCAIGSLGAARGIEMSRLDPEDARRVAQTFGIAECLAREIVWENDENGPLDETDEARWIRMRCVVGRMIETKSANV